MRLSPAELDAALTVYRSEGTYAAAARAVERDESTVRKALRRALAPEQAELMADALDASHARAVASLETARDRVLRTMESTCDPRVTTDCARALAEILRSLTTSRLAHARLAPAAESHEAGDLPGVVILPAEDNGYERVDALTQRIRRLVDREAALSAALVEHGIPLPP